MPLRATTTCPQMYGESMVAPACPAPRSGPRLLGRRLFGSRLFGSRRSVATMLAAATLVAGVATAAPAAARAARPAAHPTVSPTAAVALASTFAGVPYVYGGASPRGFDCSGLVHYVFGRLGVKLPRTAQQQYDASRKISVERLAPGDLVFWGGPRSIDHVAIYAGSGLVWSAPHTGARVRLQAMWGVGRRYGRVLQPLPAVSFAPLLPSPEEQAPGEGGPPPGEGNPPPGEGSPPPPDGMPAPSAVA